MLLLAKLATNFWGKFILGQWSLPWATAVDDGGSCQERAKMQIFQIFPNQTSSHIWLFATTAKVWSVLLFAQCILFLWKRKPRLGGKSTFRVQPFLVLCGGGQACQISNYYSLRVWKPVLIQHSLSTLWSCTWKRFPRSFRLSKWISFVRSALIVPRIFLPRSFFSDRARLLTASQELRASCIVILEPEFLTKFQSNICLLSLLEHKELLHPPSPPPYLLYFILFFQQQGIRGDSPSLRTKHV